MKTLPIFLLLCCTAPAFAVSGEMQKATVQAMHKIPCPGTPSANFGALAGVPGMPSVTDSYGDCVEYELRTAKVSYIIQPRRPILLLVGGDVAIKLAGSELLLRTNESAKDIRCDVRSMSLLSDVVRKENQNHAPPLCVDGIGRVVSCPMETHR